MFKVQRFTEPLKLQLRTYPKFAETTSQQHRQEDVLSAPQLCTTNTEPC